ncbi:MAG: YlxM family DNA-binding protein [Peptococcaceae bacterium]
MTLEQRTRMAVLYDLYSGLLTEKQQNVFDLYYQCDLSLGEIAAEQQISRTAVHDLIKRTEHLLEKYEAKLHLAQRELERKKILEQLGLLAEGNAEMLTLLRQLGLEEE